MTNHEESSDDVLLTTPQIQSATLSVRCPQCFGLRLDSTENKIVGQLDRRCSCVTTQTVGGPRIQLQMPKMNRKQRRQAKHVQRIAKAQAERQRARTQR